MNPSKKIIIASHRLPIQINEGRVSPSDGGLVSALNGAGLEDSSLWIGNLGNSVVPLQNKELSKRFVSVHLKPEIHEAFYEGFCNQVIWPAFHDRLDLMNFNENQWKAYMAVNSEFAQTILDTTSERTPVWVHDYHLMMLPALLKEAQPKRKVLFFLHIPWPSLSLSRKIPHLGEIAKSLATSDRIGFHTNNYKDNFDRFLEACSDPSDPKAEPAKPSSITLPIGIAPEKFNPPRNSIPKSSEFKNIVSVDRFDYSKGIDFKLLAFNDFLEIYPEHRNKVVLRQLLIPSRDKIPAYREYQKEVLTLATYINRKFGSPTWQPVQLTVGRMSHDELLDFYCEGDVAFITSRRDGMNLVSMEYVACQSRENPGVLVLSDQAGASQFLTEACIFQSYSLESAVRKLGQALSMPLEERKKRWESNVSWVQRNTSKKWAQENLKALNIDLSENRSTLNSHEASSSA